MLVHTLQTLGVLLDTFLVGAVTARLWGGLLKLPGDAPGRLLWALPFALIAYFHSGGSWQKTVSLSWVWADGRAPETFALLTLVCAYIGSCFGEYGALSMGHRGGPQGAKAVLFITLFGFMNSLFLSFDLMVYRGLDPGFLYLTIGTLCTAPIFAYVWVCPKWMLSIPGFGYGDGPRTGYDPPDLAQALRGGVLLVTWSILV